MTECPHRDNCWMAFLNWWRDEPGDPEPCWHERYDHIADCTIADFFEREAAGEPMTYCAIEVM